MTCICPIAWISSKWGAMPLTEQNYRPRVVDTQLSHMLATFGAVCCERALAVYAQSFGGILKHYRDAQNREIDAVVELDGGTWGAFEIKLGANQIDEAAAHLPAMRRLMERDAAARPPPFSSWYAGCPRQPTRDLTGLWWCLRQR